MVDFQKYPKASGFTTLRKLLCAFLSVNIMSFSLSGCSVFSAPLPIPAKDEVLVRVRVVDDLAWGTNEMAYWGADVCLVKIKRSQFPRCISHGVLHCFNGAWHDERPNDEWCRQ